MCFIANTINPPARFCHSLLLYLLYYISSHLSISLSIHHLIIKAFHSIFQALIHFGPNYVDMGMYIAN